MLEVEVILFNIVLCGFICVFLLLDVKQIGLIVHWRYVLIEIIVVVLTSWEERTRRLEILILILWRLLAKTAARM